MSETSISIRPMQDQLLVRRDAEDRVTPGGLVIPEIADNPRLPRGRGIVIAAGPGRKRRNTTDVSARVALVLLAGRAGLDHVTVCELREALDAGDSLDVYEPMEVKVGDRVVFSKLSGDKVRDDLAQIDVEDDLLLIRESEVIAVLESEQAECSTEVG